MKHGFTLIEVLAALFVLTMGVVGVAALLTRTASVTSSVASGLTASLLSQEGLELVHNMRDANFLKLRKGENVSWQDGFAACAAGCQGDFNDAALSPFADEFLGIANGFYAQGGGTPTSFKRKLTITQLSQDILEVASEVTWSEKGAPKSITASTHLTNWLNPSP